MQDTRWCEKCQDQPLQPGQHFCKNCLDRWNPKDQIVVRAGTLIPDDRAWICDRCSSIVGDHKDGCPLSRRASLVIFVIVAAISGLACLFGVFLGALIFS
jgi:hypothetical protein